MSDSVRSHRWKPARLPHPWDSPGKSTGVECHCLLWWADVNRHFFKEDICCCCSVAKLLSNSLQPHGLQHTSLPCPSVSPGVCSNSCPLNQWCYPHISSSVIPFSSSPRSFPASGSFPVSQLFASSDRSIGASASASVLPMNREWQTTPIFLPWEPHEQYEKKTYRLPKSTWKDAQHC